MNTHFHSVKVLLPTLALLTLAACHSSNSAAPRNRADTGLRGYLIPIGGGLDDDNKPVYERFIQLASHTNPPAAPRIIIATTASGDEPAAATGKTESIRAYCPDAQIDIIGRTTTSDDAVKLIDESTAMFFTGGDQKRIVDKYRPDGVDTPEALAMRRLLDRNGVIAGTSAGDAMMSDPMFLTGRSAEALGIRSTRLPSQRAADDDADEKRPEIPLGPQIGHGMNILPWAIADSHFFERHRFGRLVAALEQSGKRFGLGIGEDAAVEIDLATGELSGLSVADSLLVDAGSIARDGLTRRGVRANVIQQGTRISLTDLLDTRPPKYASLPQQPSAAPEEVPVVEPGQNRQLASWRFFTRAQTPGNPPQLLKLDGYDQLAWPGSDGWSIITISPQSPTVAQP